MNYLLLEVLPRLAEGVVAHVQDVFFPREYLRTAILDKHHFWRRIIPSRRS